MLQLKSYLTKCIAQTQALTLMWIVYIGLFTFSNIGEDIICEYVNKQHFSLLTYTKTYSINKVMPGDILVLSFICGKLLPFLNHP